MKASTSNIPRQPLKVERDTLGRFYVVGPRGRYSDGYPETPRQACERQARDMQRQAVYAAINAAVAAVVKLSTVITRVVRLVATSAFIQRALSNRH